jgi:hypothetical protein
MKHLVRRHSTLLVVLGLGIGFLLRLFFASRGFTYDMESYELVARLMTQGENVYAATSRYNYGPFWFYILEFFYRISQWFADAFFALRYMVAIFLSIVDIGIFVVLSVLYSRVVAWLYYFNPISIVVTGLYSQFDNIALLLGLGAVVLYEKKKRPVSGLLVLGLSLIVKHVFFAFPLWLFFREKQWKDKLRVLLLPLGIFFLSFVPFLAEGWNGVRDNVFLYSSFDNAPLWNLIIPDGLKRALSPTILFALAVSGAGYLAGRLTLAYSIAWYGVVLVAFSPAVAEQYFVYTLPFISLYPHILFAAFVYVQSVFLWVMMQGGEIYSSLLQMRLNRQMIGFSWQIGFLFFGLLATAFHPYIKRLHMRHICFIFCGLILVYVTGVYIPSRQEDRIVSTIERTLSDGDYEKANDLYDQTQRDPPFAGSRFWNKLRKSRVYVEYYRNYVHAKDLYADSASQSWEQIYSALEHMPREFRYREEVGKLRKESEEKLGGRLMFLTREMRRP